MSVEEPVCATSPTYKPGATLDADHCYWCRNQLSPAEAAGTHNLGALYGAEAINAMAAQMDAAGQDPTLAPVRLHRQATTAARR